MSGSSHPTRATIEAVQLEQLRSLVAELFPGNRFYSRKLNEAGITFDIAGLDDFCRRFPFTTKDELIEDQRLHPPFGTNLTYPLARYTRYHQTSGTTGVPLRWLDTPESWDSMLASWTEVFRAEHFRPARQHGIPTFRRVEPAQRHARSAAGLVIAGIAGQRIGEVRAEGRVQPLVFNQLVLGGEGKTPAKIIQSGDVK